MWKKSLLLLSVEFLSFAFSQLREWRSTRKPPVSVQPRPSPKVTPRKSRKDLL